MKKITQSFLILLLGFFLWNTAGSTMQVAAADTYTQEIRSGIFVGPVDISGMTEEEAKQHVLDYVEQLKTKTVTLTYEDKSSQISIADLGLTWNNQEVVGEAVTLGKAGNIIDRYKSLEDLKRENKVYDLDLTINQDELNYVIETQRETYEVASVNATLTRIDGQFVITDETVGLGINKEETMAAITTALEDHWNYDDITVPLSTVALNPAATRENLSQVKDVLGTYQTTYSTGSGRSQNVSNGAAKINGSVVCPGQEFSVYQAVSPFDAENGYAEAGSYLDGTVVQTYGGGICQVSTTLFNAVLNAELDVTERFPHSMMVTYVDPSMDAAISGTYKDFKFVNNLDIPIYIEGAGVDGVLTFTIYGKETRDPKRYVEYQSETLTKTPADVVLSEDSEAPIGSFVTKQTGHDGATAQLWKAVYQNGEQISRDIVFSSEYQKSAQIISVGTQSSNPKATEAMKKAIEAYDLEKCQTLAQKYAGSSAVQTPDSAKQQGVVEEQQVEKDTSSKKKKTSETTDDSAQVTEGTAASSKKKNS